MASRSAVENRIPLFLIVCKRALERFLSSLFIIFGRDDDIDLRDCFKVPVTVPVTVPVSVPDRAPDTNNETIL